ncbi:MAG: SDR family NAD(P)-dependent oxidoreductase [Spirochaetota bacterium]
MSNTSSLSRRFRNLAGKTVVITGSSRGIGRETAHLCVEAGARVVLHGRNEAKLNDVAQALREKGGSVRVVVGDICDPATATALRNAADELSGCDILINNAGTSMRGAFGDIQVDVLESVLRTNVIGSSVATQAFLPHLIQNRGSVVFVSSVSGMRGFPGISIYSAAKMALTALAQSIRAETSGTGLHVGILYVGFTENDPDKEIYNADGSVMHSKRKHDMTQRDVAAEVLFVADRRKNRRILTSKGWLLLVLDRLAPWIVDTIINRSGGRFHSLLK